MTVPVVVPVQKVDFRLFHDEIIQLQRGDIRFFLIFRTPSNNEFFTKNMELKNSFLGLFAQNR